MTDNSPIRLRIGILAEDPAWKILLDQIGVDWSLIGSENDYALSTYSVIIINHIVTEQEKTNLLRYSASGGAIIYTVDEKHEVRKKAVESRYISSLPHTISETYSFSDIFDVFDTTYLFQNGELISSETLEQGLVSYLGIDIKKILSYDKPIRKNFFAKRERLPHEIVAKRSKLALRQIIQSHLEFLHHRRNIPFVHKWFYPEDHATLFTFRIDSDKGTELQIDEIFQLSEQYHIPTTWFLDVKSHESWLKYFTKYTAQEIGVHCYEHIIFADTELNSDNFSKALSLLRGAGFTPKGIAAPTGAWDRSISDAIQGLGFSYSSEFSYDYDNLPSFPFFGDAISPVVQLPTHPICIGTMRREHMSAEEMIRYYRDVIDQRITNREPICLYHHPTHTTNEVFEEVFRYINEKKILAVSYTDYAEWWKRRNEFIFAATVQNNEIVFENNHRTQDAFVRVSLKNKKEKITPVSNALNLARVDWDRQSNQIEMNNTIQRTRKFTFRHYIQNALDWWIKITE
jgi:hypothetical protein